MSDKWLNLLLHCLADISKYNVRLKFASTERVYLPDERIHTVGYWDDDDQKNPILAVATGGKIQKWGTVFAHEYCHFRQWVEKTKEWKINKNMTAENMDRILHNEPVSKKILNSYLDATRDLEADCEKRTVKLLNKFQIPINITKYIKEANIYIYYHNHLKTYRQWYGHNEQPYKNKLLLDNAPSVFQKSYVHTPEKLAIAFEKVYPSKKKNNIK